MKFLKNFWLIVYGITGLLSTAIFVVSALDTNAPKNITQWSAAVAGFCWLNFIAWVEYWDE